ncbi:transcription factor bHLH95-like [Rutidosis leptorrhynchoides]|uniref:transcription factor bHLH95-like n=1 Tax=Rutidosis leptorrhynchoides TaxID=125765 RepID=UPI003A994F76
MAKEVSYDEDLMEFLATDEMTLMAHGGDVENHGFLNMNTNQQPHNSDDMEGLTDEKGEKKLARMYDTLRAFLPQLSPKVGRIKLVDEVLDYIKSLEQTVENLERKKLEMVQGAFNCANANFTPPPSVSIASQNLGTNSRYGNKCTTMDNLGTNSIVFKSLTSSSSNVVVHVCDSEAHINICCLKKPGLMSSVCHILVKNNLDVVTANISSDDANTIIVIHVRVDNNHINIPRELAGEVLYEEIYKKVANEIMLIVNNGVTE